MVSGITRFAWPLRFAPYPAGGIDGGRFTRRRCHIGRRHRAGAVVESATDAGLTGFAAANTGRQFIGIEKHAEFFRIAADVLGVPGREASERPS
jgi:hypothetical protein